MGSMWVVVVAVVMYVICLQGNDAQQLGFMPWLEITEVFSGSKRDKGDWVEIVNRGFGVVQLQGLRIVVENGEEEWDYVVHRSARLQRGAACILLSVADPLDRGEKLAFQRRWKVPRSTIVLDRRDVGPEMVDGTIPAGTPPFNLTAATGDTVQIRVMASSDIAAELLGDADGNATLASASWTVVSGALVPGNGTSVLFSGGSGVDIARVGQAGAQRTVDGDVGSPGWWIWPVVDAVVGTGSSDPQAMVPWQGGVIWVGNGTVAAGRELLFLDRWNNLAPLATVYRQVSDYADANISAAVAASIVHPIENATDGYRPAGSLLNTTVLNSTLPNSPAGGGVDVKGVVVAGRMWFPCATPRYGLELCSVASPGERNSWIGAEDRGDGFEVIDVGGEGRSGEPKDFVVVKDAIGTGERLLFSAVTPPIANDSSLSARRLYVLEPWLHPTPHPILLNFDRRLVGGGLLGGAEDVLNPRYLSVWRGGGVGGRDLVMFAGTSVGSGEEPYVYDGASIPRRIHDIVSGSGSSTPRYFTVFNGRFIFTATDALRGRELFQYSPTHGNRVALLADILPGTPSSSPSSMIVFANQLFFAATTAAKGREVMILRRWNAAQFAPSGNGDESVHVALDLVHGSGSSDPDSFVTHAGMLWFVARRSETSNRRVVWATDASLHARVVWDAMYSAADPSNLVLSGGRLFFGAHDGRTGRELHAIPEPLAWESRIHAPAGFSDASVCASAFGAFSVPAGSLTDSVCASRLQVPSPSQGSYLGVSVAAASFRVEQGGIDFVVAGGKGKVQVFSTRRDLRGGFVHEVELSWPSNIVVEECTGLDMDTIALDRTSLGSSVAVAVTDADDVLVAAGAPTFLHHTGIVFVYRRLRGNVVAWGVDGVLSVGESPGDAMGSSVSIVASSNYCIALSPPCAVIAVGAPGARNGDGKVRIYRRRDALEWDLEATLVQASSGAHFGASVVLRQVLPPLRTGRSTHPDLILLVGAPSDNRVHSWQRFQGFHTKWHVRRIDRREVVLDEGGWLQSIEGANISLPILLEEQNDASFGFSIDYQIDRILIGAPGRNGTALSPTSITSNRTWLPPLTWIDDWSEDRWTPWGAGSAFVYRRALDPHDIFRFDTSPEAHLRAHVSDAGPGFGASVAWSAPTSSPLPARDSRPLWWEDGYEPHALVSVDPAYASNASLTYKVAHGATGIETFEGRLLNTHARLHNVPSSEGHFVWERSARLRPQGVGPQDRFGVLVASNEDGSVTVMGAPGDSWDGVHSGAIWVTQCPQHACPAGFYASRPCGPVRGKSCLRCSSGPCPNGMEETSPCSLVSDRICTPITATNATTNTTSSTSSSSPPPLPFVPFHHDSSAGVNGRIRPSSLAFLLSLYNATAGARWKVRWDVDTDGLPSSDPCQYKWFGVQCNSKGELISIRLPSNTLSGTLPSTLFSNPSSVAYLEEFVLHDNYLTGTVPSLVNLKSLRIFDIGANRFSGSLQEASLTSLELLQAVDVLGLNPLEAAFPLDDESTVTCPPSSSTNTTLCGVTPPSLGTRGVLVIS